MRERREVAGRADAPAARHDRDEAAVQAAEQQLDGLDARTRVALRERVRAQKHRGPDDLVGIRLADAARVRAQKAQLELLGQLLRDRARDEAAEPRVDAVRVLARAMRSALDELAGGAHLLPRRVGELDRRAVHGDRPDVVDGQILAGETDARHAASLRSAHVTARKSSYRSLASLEHDLSRCRACAEAGYPLQSLPVRAPLTAPPQRAYLLGQAPGPVEGVERRPWRGSAGRKLRQWLELGEEEFYACFYCASVTRCDPGRSPTGRGDRTPEPEEQALCGFWRDWEIELLGPQLVVTVGLLALRRELGFTSLTEHTTAAS